jgi:hypothetical protein
LTDGRASDAPNLPVERSLSDVFDIEVAADATGP